MKWAPGLLLLIKGLGFGNWIKDVFKFVRAPSTRTSSSLYRCYKCKRWNKFTNFKKSRNFHQLTNKWFHKFCLQRTFGFPTKIKAYLALVSATFSLLGSAKNPIPWCSLDLTQEMMMISFSLPWKASTEAISTAWYNWKKMVSRRKFRFVINSDNTVQKFHDFSNTQIFFEIKFGDSTNEYLPF